jgi:hypothetical protein
MRRLRRSWLVAVHRWLFRATLVVVIASALSRVDDDDRLPRDRSVRIAARGSELARRSAEAGTAEQRDQEEAAEEHDERGAPLFAFAACP